MIRALQQGMKSRFYEPGPVSSFEEGGVMGTIKHSIEDLGHELSRPWGPDLARAALLLVRDMMCIVEGRARARNGRYRDRATGRSTRVVNAAHSLGTRAVARHDPWRRRCPSRGGPRQPPICLTRSRLPHRTAMPGSTCACPTSREPLSTTKR